MLYAGALDIAVGPRWYSTYEMACNCVTHYLEQQKISAIPYAGTTAKELALLHNTEPLTASEAEAFLEVVLRQQEPAYLEHLSRLLLAGKGPRQILDVLQIGAAQVLLETQDSLNFSISQHCYEYCNTLGWFYDTFEHPQRLKLLYSAASFLNRNAWHQRDIGEGRAYPAELPSGAERMSQPQLLERTMTAIVALDGPQAVAWARAYLASGADRQPWCNSWRSPPAASATIRTIKRSPSACSRTTPRTAASTATGCCSPASSTPPCTGSTAISSSAAGATAGPWVSPRWADEHLPASAIMRLPSLCSWRQV